MKRDRCATPDRTRLRSVFRQGAFALTLFLGGAVLSAPSAKALDRKADDIAAQRPKIVSLNDALMHDAASPIVGNPDGDVTIVAFVDYNCPYCKKSEADLDALISNDPKIRVIYKDLPVLAKSSVTAAKVAIASSWQGRYAEVHKSLMRMNARPATDSDISQAVVAAGVDLPRLNRDLDRRDGEIVALLKRNIAEADALQLKGTPVYLIGPFITASPLDFPQFKKIVADAREDQAKERAP
jgi:protein-disulfide isomerase